MNRLLPLAGLLVLAIVAFVALRSAPPVREGAAPAPSEAARAGGRAAGALPALDGAPEAARATRYRMQYSASWGAAGAETRIEIGGRWDQQILPDGRVRIALGEVTASEHAALPTAAGLEGAFALEVEDGALVGIAVPPNADELTRRTLGALATLFWARLGDGAEWRQTEEDLTGQFEARYARRGAVITKTIERYTALRGPAGLSPAGVATVRPGGETRFTFDAHGLVRADVETTLSSIIDERDALTLRINARLVREDAELAPLAAADLRTNRFADLVDFQGADAQIDAELVGEHDMAGLLAQLGRTAELDRATKAGRDARSLLSRRLSALLRLEPAAAVQVAAAIKSRAAAGEPTGLLIGAMASADTAAATDALADLVGQVEGGAERDVLNGLNLAGAATEHSLDVLTEALDGENESAAAMALGNQARTLAEDAPEAAKSAVERLLEGLAAAQSPAEKVAYIQALGNAGDRQALPALSALIQNDPSLAGQALLALRFMPGDDVDALLAPHVRSVGQNFDPALEAVSYRDATRWTAPLTTLRDALQALESPPQQPLKALNTLLARWTG